MKCATCRELLTAYLKDELDEAKRVQVEEHLAQCAECAREAEGARKVLVIVDRASEPSVVALAKEIIQSAIEAHASDIHIQRLSESLAVRYRVDGVLHDVRQLDRALREPVVDCIKQMSDMSVTEKRVPQDGRIHVRHQDKNFDIRVSTMPSVLGEVVAMRILDQLSVPMSLDTIGMREEVREKLLSLVQQPCGLFLVTGPAGSGRTTTLYSILAALQKRELHIMSVEDPVEYRFDGVTQVHVNRKAGLTYATALRYFLRQDPDIIICGELPDLETANMAVHSALTGHLVLSTIYTNDSVGAIRRLVDMGMERFALGASLTGVLAQRLVRRICNDCRQEQALSETEGRWLRTAGLEAVPQKLWAGVGCDNCKGTGHRGRTALHELFAVDEETRAMLSDGTDLRDIERAAASKLQPMRYDAALKVVAGDTTAQEAMRVLAFMPKYE